MEKKNGFTSIPNEMLEKLLHKDLTALQFRIMIALYRFIDGYNNKRGGYLTLYGLHKIVGGNHKRLRENLYILKALKYLKVEGNNKMGYKVYPIQSVYHTKSTAYTSYLTDCKLTNDDYVPHDSQIEPTESSDCETLNKTNKENINKININTQEFDEEIEEIIKSKEKPEIDTKMITRYMRKTRWFKDVFYTQVADLIYEYGQNAFIRSVEIMEKKVSIPCHAVAYLKGVIKNEALNPTRYMVESKTEPLPEPDEPPQDPIWGNFLPYKKYFKDCKKAFNLKPNGSDEYTDEELEALEEIDNFFINKILPKVRTLFPGYVYDPNNPKLDKVFEAYEELK